MNHKVLIAILLTAPATLAAQEVAVPGAPAGAMPPPSLMGTLAEMGPMFLIVFMIFYFMVIKPQSSKLRDQEKLIESLKRGDQVITSGGIIGRVAGAEKDHILLEIANNVKIKVEPTHIAKKFEKEKDKEKSGSTPSAAA